MNQTVEQALTHAPLGLDHLTEHEVQAPLGLDEMEPRPVLFWAYRYPDGGFWSWGLKEWPASSDIDHVWKIASRDVNDVAVAMRASVGCKWDGDFPEHSGRLVQLPLSELTRGPVAIIDGFPHVEEFIDPGVRG